MLDIWSVKTGYNLGTFEEKVNTTIPLPVKTTTLLVDYKIISGRIPPGMRIQGTNLVGTPLEVARPTVFTFVIRASNNNNIADRTLNLTIEGADVPEILDTEGLLPVGPNQTFFVLDSTPISFQINAIDFDTSAGQNLNFFINPKEGSLPPGLKMDQHGLISGFVDPLLAVPINERDGGYDSQVFDAYGYDFGIRPDNGFDSFNFDVITFDYTAPARGLRKLNRNYEFIVTVTDGDSFIKRKFRIYVVGEDFLRADNTFMRAGNNTYLASNTALRAPIWITPPNLGLIRSNNYHIVKLDIYETLDFGAVQYYLEQWIKDTKKTFTAIKKIIKTEKNFLGSSATSVNFPATLSQNNGPGLNLTFKRITFGANHNLNNQNVVIYNSNSNQDIEGLTNGSLYYVKKISDTIIELYSDVDLTNIINISRASIGSHELVYGPGINLTFNRIIFNIDHNLNNSDHIIYNNNGQNIGGIKSGQLYFVKKISNRIVELYSDYNLVNRIDLTRLAVGTHKLVRHDNEIGCRTITIKNPTATPLVGEYVDLSTAGEVNTNLDTMHKILNVIPIATKEYRLVIDEPLTINLVDNNKFNSGMLSELPKGLQLSIKNGELFGLVPYQSDILKRYTFTVTATRFGQDTETSAVSRTFSIGVISDVDSSMTWITPINLGNIEANYVSTLNVIATSTLANPVISYEIISGRLPPGLNLQSNGEITGRIRQYSQNQEEGLTTFYDTLNGQRISNQTFDGNETSFDRTYRFVIRAQDQVNYSSIDREFILNIQTPNDRLYSNIYVTSYMSMDKRQKFFDLINNETVFPQTHIYRFSDPNFGVKRDLRMLIYAGIETKAAGEFISIIGLNHKKKRFRFGDIKVAKARIPETNNIVYEVIYIDMVDPQDQPDKHLPLIVKDLRQGSNRIGADLSNYIWRSDGQDIFTGGKEPFLPRPFESMTIDRTNHNISDFNTKNRYPSTLYNWRQRIRFHKDVNGVELLTEKNFLPLWMRSFQDDLVQLGYIPVLPLCFCKPGMSEDVYLNIKNYNQTNNFDFKDLDYTVDRYIIDSVTGYGNDKYLVFKSHEATI